jgi:CRISPR-associated endonuclease/helicase Cas3
MMLSPDDFAAFFTEVYGYEPFPWQERLLQQVAQQGKWSSVLDLPTGSGKTAAIDVAVFHLALEADRREARRAPVRIAFVVDRRLVVDDAFTRAQALANTLAAPTGSVTTRVAERLKLLAGDGLPLIARRLRGGIPREDDWARTPSQPTVLCSTVDQVGSRLLFRGYGVSDSMKPVHAGLIGSDCLILLDEAHLAEPFRQTLGWVQVYRGRNWRKADNAAPWGVTLLTATPGSIAQDSFALNGEDRSHPLLSKRLEASKPARLVGPAKTKAAKTAAAADIEGEETGSSEKELVHRATAIATEVHRAIDHFKDIRNGAPAAAIGVVVNRVARARAVFERLRREFKEEIDTGAVGEPILMIGPARPLDRDELVEILEPIRTRIWKQGERRTLNKPLILVATQCIEAGVDIDLDALLTEAAPLDALRQRFGRLNRAGRDITPFAAVIAAKSDLSGKVDDAVYGKAIKPAWDYLAGKPDGTVNGYPIVDFGLNAFNARMKGIAVPSEALSSKDDAPILLPAHVDLLSHTSPIPAADPEVALYLHGSSCQPDSISVIWRADINPEKHQDRDVRRLLTLVPPRSGEAVELPLWAVRRWLMESDEALDFLADTASTAPEGEERPSGARVARAIWRVFRWKGDDELSQWVEPTELRPGDAIVVPASYGGVDRFGWNPQCEEAATDLGHKAAGAFAGHRFAARVAPGLLGESVRDEGLADALAAAPSQRWQDLRATLFDLNLPKNIRDELAALDSANKKKSVVAYLDVYGTQNECPRGVVFVAPFGINGEKSVEDGLPNSTEDDTSGSIPGFRLTLEKHSEDVERKAQAFAQSAGLQEARVSDLKLAGFLHDLGKVDPRFQAWLDYGDPLGPDLDGPAQVLAKSGRPLPRAARAASGLPEGWRHEALSVRLAPYIARFAEANDPELVLWLVGAHHGHGRPFFPHHDPEDAKSRDLPSILGLPSELPPGSGPQSLAFDYEGADWPAVFARLKARYGVWELARMEAILRLADHRASEERAAKEELSS